MPAAVTSLSELPRLPTRRIGQMVRLMRPGAHESPLVALGERFVLSPPTFPSMLVTYNIDDVTALFADSDAFSVGQVLRRFSSHDVMFGKQTLIFLDGAEHRQERRIYTPVFRDKVVCHYEDPIAEVVGRHAPTWPLGRPIEILPLAYDLALGVLLRVVFGDTQPDRLAELTGALDRWLRVLRGRAFGTVTALTPLLGGFTLPYPPVTRGAAEVDAVVMREIAERRSARTGQCGEQDMLSHFVGTDLDKHDDAALARDVRGIVLGGYETIGITLGWIMAMLASHPHVMATLDAAADAGDIDSLDRHLDAVVTETMRLRPVAPFTGRSAVRDTTLNGIQIPSGTVVLVPILLIHESPQHYSDPTQFRPDRFLTERTSTKRWLTFGGGAHRCLGANLALLEARVVLRTILLHHRIDSTAGPVEPPRSSGPGLTPANRAIITLRRRTP